MTASPKPQQLIGREQLRALGTRSDRIGLLQLGLHLGLLLGLGILASTMSDSVFHLCFVFLYGIPLIFLFAPLHESIHNTAFASRWMNEWVAAICGFLLFIPARYFRLFHFDHHRFTQQPGKDPELEIDKPATRRAFWWHVSGLPTWWSLLKNLLLYSVGQINDGFVRYQDRAVLIREARLHLALYGLLVSLSLIASNDFLWWYWWLPALLGQPLLRLYLLAEHHGCDLGEDMLGNSRTTKTNILMSFLAWNMPFHSEHHYLPSIPFHQLPRLHSFLKHQIKFQQTGYLALMRDIYRRLDA